MVPRMQHRKGQATLEGEQLMSREQEHDRIKQLEAVQDRIVEGKLLSVEDRIACWWGMQCRINSYKEHLYGMEYFWDNGTHAPEGFVEEKIKSEQKACPLGETPAEEAMEERRDNTPENFQGNETYSAVEQAVEDLGSLRDEVESVVSSFDNIEFPGW
jgi:hypothetical protein